jgi:Immunity protein 51
MDEFAPCFLVDQEDGSYSLCFDRFELVGDALAARELQGGGYTWHAIVEGLLRTHAPQLEGVVDYDPEASMFVAYGTDREALKTVAELIRRAVSEPAFLTQALESADPELLE